MNLMLCNRHYINYMAGESKLYMFILSVAMDGIIGILCKLFDYRLFFVWCVYNTQFSLNKAKVKLFTIFC